jgi:hypothetical protein
MTGLPEERVPHLKKFLLDWLDAEPRVGRRFIIYVGPDDELSDFVMLITGVEDGCWILWDERHHSRSNKQFKLAIPLDAWGRYLKRGYIFCADWI